MTYLNPAIFNNTNYQLVLVLLYSVVATWLAVPYVRKKCRQHGYMVLDMHKWGRPKIAVFGGIAILVGIFTALVLSELFFMKQNVLGNLFIFYFIVLVYGLYGMLDNLFKIKRRYDKILVLLLLSIPIATLITSGALDLVVMQINVNIIYLLILAPIYIMVVANLINLHAGFNGLSSGTVLIMLIAAGIKSFLLYGTTYLLYLMPVLGGVLVFFFYNKYPAKILEGNVGTMIMGSALGAFLIVNNLEVFGIIILIPHIITFVLDTIVLGILKRKDIEFPMPRKDHLIVIDKSMRYKSLKNVICTWFRLTEEQAANILFLITGIFCLIGILWI